MKLKGAKRISAVDVKANVTNNTNNSSNNNNSVRDLSKAKRLITSPDSQDFLTKSFVKKQNEFVGNTGIGESQFDDNIPLSQIGNLDKIRAKRQPISHQFTNAILGGAASGAIGAIEGFSNIADQLINIGNEAEEWERGTISQILKDAKDSVNASTPIYRKDRDDVFDWDDPGFYFETLKGAVDSAVAFGIPGMGYGAAVGKLGNVLGKVALNGKRLDVITRAGGRAIGMSNASGKVGAFTSGFLSNYNEGTVMAMQVYDEQKEKFIEQLTSAKLVEKGGQSLTREEIEGIEKDAVSLAGVAAENVRSANKWMMISNYVAASQLFKKGTTTSRNMVSKPTFKKWAQGQAKAAPLEGGEEIVQGVIQQEQAYQAQKSLIEKHEFVTPDDEYKKLASTPTAERYLDFATSDEALLEGLMGFVSGPIQFAVTGSIGYKARQEEQLKKHMSQQTAIAQNEEFIKKQLAFGEDKAMLMKSFNQFNKEVIGKETDMQKAQEQFEEVVDNTAFQNLAIQNFFAGTTENLEKQLQSKVQDENSTDDEKKMAEEYLKELTSLESQYQDFMNYQDGAQMFGSKLRADRLTKISNMVDEAYTKLEADSTMAINAKLESNAKKNKNLKASSLGEILFYEETENNVTSKVPINSVTEYINAQLEGKKVGYDSRYKSIYNELNDVKTKGGRLKQALSNRVFKNSVNERKNQATTALDEARSSEYENEFAKFVDINNIEDTEKQLKELEKFSNSLFKKYGKERFINLQARVKQNAERINLALTMAEKVKDEQSQAEIAEKKKQVEKEKITKKNPVKAKVKANISNEKDASEEADQKGALQIGPEDAEELSGDEGVVGPDEGPLGDFTNKRGLFGDKKKESKDGDTTADNSNNDDSDSNQAKENKQSVGYKDTTVEKKTDGKSLNVRVKDNGDVVLLDKNGKEGAKVKSESVATKAKIKANKDAFVTIPASDGKYIINPDTEEIYYFDEKANDFVPLTIDDNLEEQLIKLAINKKNKKSESKANARKIEKADVVHDTQLVDDGDKKDTLDDFEPKPSGPNDNAITVKKINDVSNSQLSLFEEVKENEEDEKLTPKNDIAKLMTIGNSPFINNVLNNGRNKTGTVVDVSVSQITPKSDNKTDYYAKKALTLYNKYKKQGIKSLNDIENSDDVDMIVKYAPVIVDFGNNATTFVYPMNWKNDSKNGADPDNKYTDKHHLGELEIRIKAINASLAGTTVKAKIKGQTPGTLNFGKDDKMLIEMDSLAENPMGVNMFVSIDGSLQPVNKGTKRNPFVDTQMTYETAEGTVEPWTGIFVIEVKAVNGTSFPLKVNTRNHTDDSAEIIYELYKNVIDESNKKDNILNIPVSQHNKKLYNKIVKLIPSAADVYGDFTYKNIINDFIFEGLKTKGRTTEIYFEKGSVVFNGKKVNSTNFNNDDIKKEFVNFIKEYKSFNVRVGALADPNYRKHVFTNYLSTNADIDDMITASGETNPTSSSIKRMKSGAMYLDVKDTTVGEKIEAKVEAENNSKTSPKSNSKKQTPLKKPTKLQKKQEEVKKAEKKAEKEEICNSKKSLINKFKKNNKFNI